MLQSSPPPLTKSRLQELLAKVRASKAQVPEPSEPTSSGAEDRYGNQISYNSKQQEFISLAASGASCVLIGAAGTGKTTCQKGATHALIQSGRAGILEASAHKTLISGTPGIVICAFTRRAVSNIRQNLPKDLQANCLTIHSLLEYAPVYEEVLDPESGNYKNTMSFQPGRSALNPLPSSIRCIIFEETSMLGTDLYQEVVDACPHNPQMIFLGDICQLPPVFGPAILGFKLLSLPAIELTEVYRQALDSPIISLAHRILSGNPLLASEFPEWKHPDKLTIHPWKKKIDAQMACQVAGNFFTQAFLKNQYNPQEDMILIPFNKNFGTDELNKIIATQLAKSRNAEVHEIIAGFQKIYLSVGDKILVDKEDAVITRIETNPGYAGAPSKPSSKTMDYWGHDSACSSDSPEDDMDFLLLQVASQSKDVEDRVRQCSHKIFFLKAGSEIETSLSSAGDVNQILLGYVLTVHKAQGSEWNKVFLVLHQSHATMNSRELLYTAVTRAKKELYIICEPETLERGIKAPRIKGETMAEKAIYFQGKLKRIESEGF